jgi:hypothetical protein
MKRALDILKKIHPFKESRVGQIASILELLQGRLSKNVMSVVTYWEKGLPYPKRLTEAKFESKGKPLKDGKEL